MKVFLEIVAQVAAIALVVIGGLSVLFLVLSWLGVVEPVEMDDEDFL